MFLYFCEINATKFGSKNLNLHTITYNYMTSYGYIIMIIVDSCMIWFNFDCIMQLQKNHIILLLMSVAEKVLLLLVISLTDYCQPWNNLSVFIYGIFLELMCYTLCQSMSIITPLTHCGLVTPYGDIDLGQNNVDFTSVMSGDSHLREISPEIPGPSIIEMSLKVTYFKWYSNLPGANELMIHICYFYR